MAPASTMLTSIVLMASTVCARTSYTARGVVGVPPPYDERSQIVINSDPDVALPDISRSPEEVTRHHHEFRWSNIDPSKELVFHPCFEQYDCARLAVPLDWNSTKDDPEPLALAIIRLPAKVPITDPRYGGVILHNPGGPGGSGVAAALKYGHLYQSVFDAPSAGLNETAVSSTNKYYDFLSWDPRGVNNTTPFATCIPDVATLSQWTSYPMLPGSAETSFEYLWARQQAFTATCAMPLKEDTETPNILNHAGTTDTVLDMVAILESFGAWRENQARALAPANVELQARLAHKKGEEPLNFYGVSYGTTVGSTFAAMQPHRVHRVILDSVMDVPDYFGGDWTGDGVDFEPLMDRFFAYCFAAGRDCEIVATAEDAGFTVENECDLRKVWKHIELQLPLAVPATAESKIEVITSSDFKMLLFHSAYTAVTVWPKMVEIIAPLIQGNGTAFAKYKHKDNATTKKTNSALCPDIIDPYNVDCAREHSELISEVSGTVIQCIDGDFALNINRTEDDFKNYLQHMRQNSRNVGQIWAQLALGCVGWPGRAGWKYYQSGDPNRDIASNATAHPVLWVTNELDPATPRRQAVEMQEKFDGSILMNILSEGHGFTANPSLSASRTMRHYFQTGELPDPATTHLPHRRAFLGAKGPNVEPLPEKLDSADRELMDILDELLSKRSSL